MSSSENTSNHLGVDFNSMTLMAAGGMISAMSTQAGFKALILEWGIHNAISDSGSVASKVNELVQFAKDNMGQYPVPTVNGDCDLSRAMIERAITASKLERDHNPDIWSRLVSGLKNDGFEIVEEKIPDPKGGTNLFNEGPRMITKPPVLRCILPNSISQTNSRQIESETEDLLDHHETEFPKSHLKQEINNYLQQNWGEDNEEFKMNIFLGYASEHKNIARQVFDILKKDGDAVWFDKESLIAGDNWDKERRNAQEKAHLAVHLCSEEIKKRKGVVNREIQDSLRIQRDQPLGVTYLIPIKIGEFDMPDEFKDIHWISFDDSKFSEKLEAAMNKRRRQLSSMENKQTPPLYSHKTETGYSPAANVIAKLYVEESKFGCDNDPRFKIDDIAEKTRLSPEDTEDALNELSDFFKIEPKRFANSSVKVQVRGILFAEFDRYWMEWNPKDDACRIAGDLLNKERLQWHSSEIRKDYNWTTRRLNPALTFMVEHDLIPDESVLASPVMPWVNAKEGEVRRFLKDEGKWPNPPRENESSTPEP